MMSTTVKVYLLAILAALFCFPSLAAATPPTVEWVKQLGSSGNDSSSGVSADGLGNVYISGYTEGSLGGTNAGGYDAFVSKYMADGTLAWTRQLGSSDWDLSLDVSADGLGNVYISGRTCGDLEGENAGMYDAFISKYTADGALAWTRQFGSSSDDCGNGVSADGLGNVYISGRTKSDLENITVASINAFVSKYTADGTLDWTRQLDSGDNDSSNGVSSDSLGNIYISGHTYGSLEGANAGLYDVFVSKYTADGTLAWTRQLGSSSDDWSLGVSSDSLGNIYISGYTYGSLEGTNAGGRDAFITKYTADGTLAWTKQVGSSSNDWSYGVSADGLGSIYISGWTEGNLGGPNAGGRDVFTAKLFDPDAVVPEPSLLLLLGLGALTLLCCRVRFGRKR